MNYELVFHPEALAEWNKRDPPVRSMFKKKLAERLENPCIPSAQLSGRKDRYKISFEQPVIVWYMKSAMRS